MSPIVTIASLLGLLRLAVSTNRSIRGLGITALVMIAGYAFGHYFQV